MSAILNLIGWPAALVLIAAGCVQGYRAARSKDPGKGIAAAAMGVLAFVILAMLGVLTPLLAGILAGLAAALAAGLALKDGGRKGAHRAALAGMRGSLGDLRSDSRGVFGWLAARFRSLIGGEEGEAPPVAEAVAGYTATRAIPPVMQDPHLGPATEPGEIAAAGVPVPAPYAALASYIGSFEPEDDQALRMFMDGHASGTIALADAWHAFADICLNGVGLSPAYVAGILEAGDSAGEHASLLAQVHKRFHVVYAAIKEWISAHGPLPNRARDFLTGED